MYFGLSLDALAGSGLTEEEETTATSSPDEAVRAGGVMEHLHSRMLLWTSQSSLLTPVCRHFRSYKDAQTQCKSSHFNNTMSFDFCIRSNKIILRYIFVSGFPPFFSQTLPSPFLAGPAPPQKIAVNAQESRIRKVL